MEKQFYDGSADTTTNDQPFDIGGTYLGGVAAHRGGNMAEAEQLYNAVLAHSWEEPETLRSLADLYIHQGKYEAAQTLLKRSLSIIPRDPVALMLLGVVAGWLGNQDDAIRYADLCLSVSPDMAGAHWNRALWLLLHGQYAEGWKEYRWGTVTGTRPVRHILPEWNGDRVKTLYVWQEQGLGDTLMMIRFLPTLRAVVNTETRIVLEVQPQLLRFLDGQNLPVDRIVGAQPDGAFAEHCEAHISLMSLPRVLAITPEWIPGESYLSINPENNLHGIFGQDELFVGLCWKGNGTHGNNFHRSFTDSSAERMATGLANISPNIRIGSLVPGESFAYKIGQLNTPDIAATAEIIASLDLVITVDTMVAHLAGAMGKPVWIMLPANCDWRWLRNWKGDDTRSPWYPSARLYRQETLGDWQPVMERIAADLKQITERHATVTDMPPPPALAAFSAGEEVMHKGVGITLLKSEPYPAGVDSADVEKWVSDEAVIADRKAKGQRAYSDGSLMPPEAVVDFTKAPAKSELYPPKMSEAHIWAAISAGEFVRDSPSDYNLLFNGTGRFKGWTARLSPTGTPFTIAPLNSFE